jgi:hypothetical protein
MKMKVLLMITFKENMTPFRKSAIINPFKDEAQTALFKDPVRTAQ